MKYIIIGGVAGGASLATRFRRLDEFCDITIYEKSHFVSYANCGLPYYIGNVIKEESSLALQSPRSLKNRFNIDVYINHEVIKINKEDHTVLVKNLLTNEEFLDTYDKLIIATGAEAIKIKETSKRIFELKNVEDTIRLKESIDKLNVKEVIVIGGGFIGLEILENLVDLGIKVTLIEGNNHILPNLDKELARVIEKELINKGIDLVLNTFTTDIIEEDDRVTIKTNKDISFNSDLVIEALGVKPSNNLAINTLVLGIKGAIKTNNNFLTSDKDIYAIGDVTSLVSLIDNKETYIPLAGLANKEGRELANHLVNNIDIDIKPIGTSILKLFKYHIATTGLNEETLKKKNIPYQKIYLTPTDHASYYPNPKTLLIKVMFVPINFYILGAEIIGENGVDKRIDLLSFAIKFKIKGYELKNLELSYAPPFSSAKDPINMIGYMIENIKDNLISQFYSEDIEYFKKDPNILLLDVRTKEEYDYGHIEESINIPVDEIRKNLADLQPNKEIYLICQSAIRSYIASRILTQHGYKCKHLAGGYRVYSLYNEEAKIAKFI